MIKKYNIKDRVWIHLGEKTLTEGRVVEIIDLEHLEEGYSKDDELYVIEIKTGIEDVYEVRSAELISPDSNGPLTLFRNREKRDETIKGNRFMRKIGIEIPASGDMSVELAEEIAEELEPTPEQIHAALERSQQATKHEPLATSQKTPKKKYYKKRPPKQ